jgi:hypothetical protein
LWKWTDVGRSLIDGYFRPDVLLHPHMYGETSVMQSSTITCTCASIHDRGLARY